MSTIALHKNGITKQIKEGFSWTTFFFGFLVMISRSMWPQAAISFLTFGMANFYYIFTLNRIYRDKLMEDGWVLDQRNHEMGA